MDPDPRELPNLDALAQRVNAAKARILTPSNRNNRTPQRVLALASPAVSSGRTPSRRLPVAAPAAADGRTPPRRSPIAARAASAAAFRTPPRFAVSPRGAAAAYRTPPRFPMAPHGAAAAGVQTPPRRLAVTPPAAAADSLNSPPAEERIFELRLRQTTPGRVLPASPMPLPSPLLATSPEPEVDSDASEPTPMKVARVETELTAQARWSEVKQVKKFLKERRKLQEKGNVLYNMEREAKSIWEDLRRKDCPTDRQRQLSEALFDLIKDNIPELLRTHDMSRVIETLMVKGTAVMRDAVLYVCSHAHHLTWSKYSCHAVQKAVLHANPEQKKTIINAFRPWFPVMMAHPRSRDVAEAIFQLVNTEQHRLKCLSIIFGGDYAIPSYQFSNVRPVRTAVEWGRFSPLVLREMTANFHYVYKDMFQRADDNPASLKYHMVHFFLTQYCSLLSNPQVQKIYEELNLAEKFLDFLSTKCGTVFVMNFFWNSGTKVRKTVLKGLKGQVTNVANQQFGHLLLLAILDSLDDTMLASRVIIKELVRNIALVMGSVYGRKIIRYLVVPRHPTDFSPEMISLLGKGDNNRHSKKDMTTRRRELLDAANDDLLTAIAEHAGAWVKHSQQSAVVAHIMLHCRGPKVSLAANAIVKQITEQKTFMTIQNGGTFSMVKRLIGHMGKVDVVNREFLGAFDAPRGIMPEIMEERCMKFAKTLVDSFTKDVMEDWLESPQGCALIQVIFEVWGGEENIRVPLLEKIEMCPYLKILEKEKKTVKSKANLYETLTPLALGIHRTKVTTKNKELMNSDPRVFDIPDCPSLPDEINQSRQELRTNGPFRINN